MSQRDLLLLDSAGLSLAPGVVLENTCLRDACSGDVCTLNRLGTDIAAQLPTAREVRDRYVNTAAPPASTAVGIAKLARDGALFEIEAVAFLAVQ